MQPRNTHIAPFIPEKLKSTLETQETCFIQYWPSALLKRRGGCFRLDISLHPNRASSLSQKVVLPSSNNFKRLLKGENSTITVNQHLFTECEPLVFSLWLFFILLKGKASEHQPLMKQWVTVNAVVRGMYCYRSVPRTNTAFLWLTWIPTKQISSL